jgi:hypothetical protein
MQRNVRSYLGGSLISLGLLGLGACGTARPIQRTQFGGVIELQGPDRNKAMEAAHQDMAQHCGPNNYTITQEGEEAVGTETIVQEDQASDSKTSRSGRRSKTDTTTTQTTSTRTATKWRVHYQCGGGAPMGAGGPPPAEPPPGPPPAAAPPSGW